MEDQTIKFHVTDDTNREMKRILTSVYCSLSEKGYNPINQIVGYLLSAAVYLVLVLALTIILSALLYAWLRKRGTKIFASL